MMCFNGLVLGTLSLYYLSQRKWSAKAMDRRIDDDDNFVVEKSPAVANDKKVTDVESRQTEICASDGSWSKKFGFFNRNGQHGNQGNTSKMREDAQESPVENNEDDDDDLPSDSHRVSS